MKQARRSAGFTLIEILVVVTIMSVLLAIAGTGASSMMESLHMKEAIESVRFQMEHARQTASTKNCEVVVRIYQEPDFDGVVAWRALEFGVVEAITDPSAPGYTDPESEGYVPPFKKMGSTAKLPSNYQFHPSDTYSTLIGSSTHLQNGSEIGIDGITRNYKWFICQPDGRCSLPTSTNWTLTIVKNTDAAGGSLPPNYATLELDPSTSRVRVYRP
jgi:uncharacterized protein (TIGR02596 family)